MITRRKFTDWKWSVILKPRMLNDTVLPAWDPLPRLISWFLPCLIPRCQALRIPGWPHVPVLWPIPSLVLSFRIGMAAWHHAYPCVLQMPDQAPWAKSSFWSISQATGVTTLPRPSRLRVVPMYCQMTMGPWFQQQLPSHCILQCYELGPEDRQERDSDNFGEERKCPSK